jgi:hypothetical protein
MTKDIAEQQIWTEKATDKEVAILKIGSTSWYDHQTEIQHVSYSYVKDGIQDSFIHVVPLSKFLATFDKVDN